MSWKRDGHPPDPLQRGSWRRQHPYGIYIIDFFCDKANLAIEVDGDLHLFAGEYDREKTRYLESAGLKVLRFKTKRLKQKFIM